jgi:hypothetical protein
VTETRSLGWTGHILRMDKERVKEFMKEGHRAEKMMDDAEKNF